MWQTGWNNNSQVRCAATTNNINLSVFESFLAADDVGVLVSYYLFGQMNKLVFKVNCLLSKCRCFITRCIVPFFKVNSSAIRCLLNFYFEQDLDDISLFD